MCNELTKIAIQNLEVLDSLDDNIDNYRLIIDGNRLSIAEDTYDGVFNLKEIEYPIFFAFNQVLNSIRYSNLYKLDGYKTKELIELMDTSIDRIAFIVDEMEEDPNHDSMTDIIDSIDEKFLIAKERALTCSVWKVCETFNDYLDTVSSILQECDRYLYKRKYKFVIESSSFGSSSESEDEPNEETGEVNPNLVYDKDTNEDKKDN